MTAISNPGEKSSDMISRKMSPRDSEFKLTSELITKTLNTHIGEGEEEGLRSLKAILDPSEPESMSKKFDRTKILMPTRSHPDARIQPFFSSLLLI